MRTRSILLAMLVGRTAAAEPVVLAVDGNDIYVELGARDGVGAGSELALIHEVVVKDPRSGATLRDHFALGTLTVARTGDKLSVAHAPAELARRVIPGDRVQLTSARHHYIDPWQDRVAPATAAALPSSAVATADVDHVELARAAWQDTLGAPPESRIARWQRLAAADPSSPYRKAIDAEIASLREQVAARDRALATARSTTSRDRDPRIATLARALAVPADDRSAPIALGPVGHALPDRPLELAFVVRDPAAVKRAWLYVRASGEPGFKRLELASDGDAYLRATVPAEIVKPPSVDWYVEVGAGERTAPALGSQATPRTIAVDRVVAEAPIARDRTHIDLHLDYVDFDSAEANHGHHDRYYLAEVAFSYRFLDPIYAVSLGFGTLSGTGGPKQVIDDDPMGQCRDSAGAGAYRCKEVTFSYVYTELEFRLHRAVALLARPQVGLLTTDTRLGTSASRCRGDDIADCKFDVGLGMRGRIRFGEETGTNLIVGAGFTSGVGTLLEASYQWLPATIVPVQLGVQVTDQPVIEDFGVRLLADVGLRRVPWFYPSLRASYQARSTNHAGFSGGLAMNFNW